LEGYFHAERDKEPQPEIHLRPDRRARYEIVAKVLAAAQRNHMKKIGFVNVAEFRD
jgi:biopolymer transport protein ExbD